MEGLTSLGLLIDKNEDIRIISGRTDGGSVEISNKIKLLLTRKSNLLAGAQ